MFKIARKPSADPAQEKLRQSKQVWNSKISAFISDIIHAKKLMNGAPNKFSKIKSSITNPIPADPNTIINSLAGDFQELAQEANGIIQDQIEYSKTRRQKQVKPTAPTSPGHLQAIEPDKAPIDLNKQLAAFELKYDSQLIAEASNPFSRFITKILTPQIGFGEGARIRRLRMTMLDNCLKAYKELKKLHKEIVGSSKSSILTSHKMMTNVWNHWNAVNRLFTAYKSLRPAPIEDTGGPIEKPKEEQDNQVKKEEAPPTNNLPNQSLPAETNSQIDQALVAMKDIQANSNNFTGISNLVQAASEFSRAPANLKAKFAEALLNGYHQALVKICQERKIPLQTSLWDILAMGTKSPVKTAQVGRWLGKARHQILPGATSGPRLEVYRLIEQAKVDLNKIMDLLEKGLDEDALTQAIGDVNKEMTSLRTFLRSLYFAEQPFPKSNNKPSNDGGAMDGMSFFDGVI